MLKTRVFNEVACVGLGTLSVVRGIITPVSVRDGQVAAECPHCHTPLIIAVPLAPAQNCGPAATTPQPAVPLRDAVQPPPVAEVLADLYAGRRRLDPPAAHTGAARARAGLAAARSAAAQRQARQTQARAGKRW